MEKQIINNGTVVLEKGNLIYLRNAHNGVNIVFSVVDIDNGYVVLEPVDYQKFGKEPKQLDDYLANKVIVKGIVSHQRIK